MRKEVYAAEKNLDTSDSVKVICLFCEKSLYDFGTTRPVLFTPRNFFRLSKPSLIRT